MGSRSLLCFLTLVFLFSLQHSNAQPLLPDVQLTRPTLHSSNALSRLQTLGSPVVGLYFSDTPSGTNQEVDSLLAESIVHWEYLLVGLELPYVLLDDSTFSASAIQPLNLLIVPEADLLADSSLSIIQAYAENGGGVIASGIHAKNRKGGCDVSRQLSNLVGASGLIEGDETATRIAQVLVGDSPLLEGIPAGFELDILPTPFCSARAGSGNAVGYQSAGGGKKSTLILTHEMGSGRVVWTGFGPQDIPPDNAHQLRYQVFMVNALVYATNTASVAIRKWPDGNQSATALMQLPSSGYQPFSYRTSTDLLLNALDSTSTPATFFLVARHAKDHPDLINRMTKQGEVALVGDTQKPLSGLRPELQLERLDAGKALIESLSGTRIRGILPPGYFYDPNTLHALVELNIDYMLSGDGVLIEPSFMPWVDELDYRDTLLIASSEIENLDSAPTTAPRPLVRLYPVLYSYDLDNPVAEIPSSIGTLALRDRWAYRLDHTFKIIHEAGGLFLFAYEPEAMGLTQERASLLKDFGTWVKEKKTWVATLGEIVNWWRTRDKVGVQIEQLSEQELTLVITNQNRVPVQDLALTGHFPGIDLDEMILKSESVDVSWEHAGERVLLQLNEVKPGSHAIRWEEKAMP